MKDRAWDRFRQTLSETMAGPPRVTSARLAAELSLDEEVIANWRRGRTHPHLGVLPKIVNALNAIRMEKNVDDLISLDWVLEQMEIRSRGAGDALLLDKALRLQKLEIKIEEANALAAELGRRTGAANIVRAAMETGRWSVAVWPAYEGPANSTPIYVADRIDIMRATHSDELLTSEDVWADLDMKAALRAARAIRERVSPRAADVISAPVSRWSILHLGSPRDPLITDPWPGLQESLCVMATSGDSWATDLAAIVALQVGYGFRSVRDLTMDIYGINHEKQTDRERLEVHDSLVAHPGRRRVWAHIGGLGSDKSNLSVRVAQASQRRTVYIVLDESDELLEESSESADEFKKLQKARDGIRAFALGLPRDRVLILPTEYRESRGERWHQVLSQAHQTLNGLVERGAIFRSLELARVAERAAAHYPKTAAPIQSWLRNNGWLPANSG